MMRRRARPSARTTRTAPTAPCVPVDRDGARVPRSVPRRRGQSPGTAPARAWKVDRSVAQGRPADPDGRPAANPRGPARSPAGWRSPSGCLLALAALAIYLATGRDRYYDHFVWQAAAFLEGQAAIRYPGRCRPTAPLGNALLPGRPADRRRRTASPRGLLPFPPLPAVVLVPFVAVWGLATDDQAIFTVLAAIDVAICWWVLGRLPVGPAVRLATTIFFAFGTVFWYTAAARDDLVPGPHRRGRARPSWPSASRSGADPAPSRTTERRRSTKPTPTDRSARRPRSTAGRRRLAVDPRQFAAGLLFGLACTARPDGRLRGPVPRVRRGRRRLAAAGLVGRARRGHPDPGPVVYTVVDDRAARSTQPTTTSTGSRRPAIRRSATTPTGASRTRATCPRTSGSRCSLPRTCFPTTLPDALGHRHDAGLHATRARPAACSTPRARSRFRATSG